LGLADRARQRQPKHGTFNETRSTAFNAQLRTPNTERKSAGRLDPYSPISIKWIAAGAV